jgi:phosphonate transport system substrate-binding protein
MARPIIVGAVAYAARAVPIWEGMRDYFRAEGPAIDYVLFSNYDSQVQALLAHQIDIAWNTNVDARFTTVIVARAESGANTLTDLRGKRVALGSADSAQAAILPLHFLRQAGLEPENDSTLLRFDLDVGKHGDTGTSELEVLRALREGQADAGALGDATWNRQVAEGKVDVQKIRPIWTSPGYCHCNFTVLADFPEDRGQHWTNALLGMQYDNPRWRELMDLEGLKRWIRPENAILRGYQVLFDAVEKQGLASGWHI